LKRNCFPWSMQVIDSRRKLNWRISPRPYGTHGLFFNATQDCATLVLGYFPFSLRENGRRLFHIPWVGKAGGRLKRAIPGHGVSRMARDLGLGRNAGAALSLYRVDSNRNQARRSASSIQISIRLVVA